jgi:YHS domain-containing protein
MSAATWQAVSVAIDPVCKMDVVEAQAKYATVYEGVKYYFCSAACKQEFEKRQTKYISR